MKNTVKATFSIVTPMFLGDAEQNAVDIRPPSIKGALRFWWRALNWNRFATASVGADAEAEALRKLHAEEARLFGISAADDGGGQGVFLLNVLQAKIVASDQPFKEMNISQLYLLGMGLATSQRVKHTLRNALIGGDFTVRLLFRPACSPDDQRSICDALFVFGLLGALGSRARHGMGSVALKEWEGDQRKVPQNSNEYQLQIREILCNLKATLPPFTAFSSQSRIDISIADKDPLDLLTKVGMEQLFYRSFGYKKYVQHRPAERNFKDDHDLLMKATQGQRIDVAPKRAVFGLPHNYRFSSTTAEASVDYAPDGSAGRRSSPLLLHIHALADGQFIAVHSLLPAYFLPKGAQMRIKSKVTSNVQPAVDWQVIRTYLNRFKQKETIYGA